MRILNKVNILILTTFFLGACGASAEKQALYQEEESQVQEDAPVKNTDNIYAYEVTLKDGRTVQCAVAYWGSSPSMECDFENSEVVE